MTTSKQPRYMSLRGQVYDYLRDELLNGRLKSGERVDLDELSRRLEVSRTPLREALIILDAEGFVTILPRSRIIINTLGLEDIRNLYEVIGALEGAALYSAKAEMGPGSAARMAELNGAMSRALDVGDWDGFYRLNLEFHGVFLVFSKNSELLRTIDLAKKRLYDFPRKKGLLTEWERASVVEHARIAEFLEKDDYRSAAEYVRDVHWSFAVQEHFIRQYYELPEDGAGADHPGAAISGAGHAGATITGAAKMRSSGGREGEGA